MCEGLWPVSILVRSPCPIVSEENPEDQDDRQTVND